MAKTTMTTAAGQLKAIHYYIALFFLLALSSSVAGCPASDRAALLAFRAALHEPYLGIFKTWTGSDCCRGWYGVSCDPRTRRVAGISLRGESEEAILQRVHRTGYMTGFISPEICKLDMLSELVIADWKAISGEIPKCISQALPFLRVFDLVGNRISGEIPENIGRLKRLEVLNLADNQISGRIPLSLTSLSSLKHLDLRNNNISGPLPQDFARLVMLSRALLGGNHISGRIPDSISRIYRLVDLDLSMNRISGSIPQSLGKMAVLATLNLDFNWISGTIPPILLTSSISNLNLSGNAIGGRIPDSFTQRSYFTALDLSRNRLRGTIPKSMSRVSFIGHLDLSHNHLCGKIPRGPPFDHLDAASFEHNECLCGKPLRVC